MKKGFCCVASENVFVASCRGGCNINEKRAHHLMSSTLHEEGNVHGFAKKSTIHGAIGPGTHVCKILFNTPKQRRTVGSSQDHRSASRGSETRRLAEPARCTLQASKRFPVGSQVSPAIHTIIAFRKARVRVNSTTERAIATDSLLYPPGSGEQEKSCWVRYIYVDRRKNKPARWRKSSPTPISRTSVFSGAEQVLDCGGRAWTAPIREAPHSYIDRIDGHKSTGYRSYKHQREKPPR